MFWGCKTRDNGARAAATPEVCRPRKKFIASKLYAIATIATVVALTALTTPAALAAPSDCPTDGQIPGTAASLKQLVIIIDDLGHNLARGREAVELPGNITYAVMPFTPFGKTLADEAHTSGKEVMLHSPMSTLNFAPLGSGGLTPDQSRREFRDALIASLEDVPHVKGVNNHMGSDLTARRQQMAWLMRELRWQGLYFVDSRTNVETVAATVAGEFSVPNLSRHVFLDNEPTAQAIGERFEILLDKVAQEGLAVGIGHPYPQTLAYLRDALPTLADKGIELLLVSQALAASSMAQPDVAAVAAQATAPEC